MFYIFLIFICDMDKRLRLKNCGFKISFEKNGRYG